MCCGLWLRVVGALLVALLGGRGKAGRSGQVGRWPWAGRLGDCGQGTPWAPCFPGSTCGLGSRKNGVPAWPGVSRAGKVAPGLCPVAQATVLWAPSLSPSV